VQVLKDLQSPTFIKALTREAIKYRATHRADPARDQRAEISDLVKRISRIMRMASELENPAPALREVDQLERARNALASEIGRLEAEYTAASMLDDISEAKIEHRAFSTWDRDSMESLSREALKDFLSTLLGQITLDPATHECQIDYRIAVVLRNKMASPRGCDLIPQLRVTSRILNI